MLELKHIDKYYNQGTINEMCLFEDFNLTVNENEFVSVVGSNGSGKTTLLNIICGSIPIDSGRIIINGKDISRMPEFKRQRTIGRVYQNPAMGTCPNMTILENMALADTKGKPFNLKRGTDKQRIDFYRENLRMLGLGLEDKLEVKVENLKDDNVASMAVLSEESRRMQEMMKMYNMYGMDPSMFGGQETLILNANNKLVQYVLENGDTENTNVICEQLYDLAVLSHRQLTPEEMTKFVTRSNDIMMMLAK